MMTLMIFILDPRAKFGSFLAHDSMPTTQLANSVITVEKFLTTSRNKPDLLSHDFYIFTYITRLILLLQYASFEFYYTYWTVGVRL